MPIRNTVRTDVADSYYHVYGRGVNKEIIFREVADKDYFLYLISRYLSQKQVKNKSGYIYPHFRDQLELLSYCLIDNHFHFLFYQIKPGSLSAFMKSLVVAYSAFINKKYKRTGPLLESRFKASLINREDYLTHISRYIHLNPRSWRSFPYSSLRYIWHANEPEWLQTEKVLAQHNSRQEYLAFVADYEEHKEMLAEVKRELANL